MDPTQTVVRGADGRLYAVSETGCAVLASEQSSSTVPQTEGAIHLPRAFDDLETARCLIEPDDLSQGARPHAHAFEDLETARCLIEPSDLSQCATQRTQHFEDLEMARCLIAPGDTSEGARA